MACSEARLVSWLAAAAGSAGDSHSAAPQVAQLLAALVNGGFALRAEAVATQAGPDAEGAAAAGANVLSASASAGGLSGFTVRLDGPANQWGAAALAARGAAAPNDYVGYAVAAFLRQSGRGGFRYSSRITGAGMEQRWTLG